MSKICKSCKIEKTLDEFYKDNKLKSGYRGRCKLCVSEYDQKRKLIKKEVIIEPIRICVICYYEKPIDNFYKNPKSKGGYFTECKVCHDLKRKERKQKEYKNQSKKKVINREQINDYYKQKYSIDMEFRLKQCIRSRLRNALNGYIKSSTSLSLLGCSIPFFKNWIEYQFEEWMNWNNYGEWHLDHVKPCSAFNLINPDEQKQCFSWENYQPLAKIKNISKKNKILDDLIIAHKEKVHQYVIALNITSKEDEGSTTRKSILKILKSMEKFPRVRRSILKNG